MNFMHSFFQTRRNYEAWEADGKITTEKRENRVWKQLLEDFEAHPISSKITDDPGSYVQKRDQEVGAATNF